MGEAQAEAPPLMERATSLDVTDAFWCKCLKCGMRMSLEDVTKQVVTYKCNTASCQSRVQLVSR